MHGQVAGYIVLSETQGQWKDDWDGEVHRSLRHGVAALRDCRDAGFSGMLVQCIIVVKPDEQGPVVPIPTRPDPTRVISDRREDVSP